MIPLGTHLDPRGDADPATVVALEADEYILAKAGQFGSPFAMEYDTITAAYDCSAWKVTIDLPSEQQLWEQLSTEAFKRDITLSNREAKKRASEAKSPNEIFAEADAKVQ